MTAHLICGNAHLICGIDPGLSGAIGLYEPVTKQIATVVDMPTYEINGKREIDLYALARFFDLWASKIRLAVIEKPGAMPGQGVSSMFKFGEACGVARTIVAAHFIPMKTPSPAQWKKAMGLTADKDGSRRLASQMLPGESHRWPNKGHDGRAEAVLLAIYGARHQE